MPTPTAGRPSRRIAVAIAAAITSASLFAASVAATPPSSDVDNVAGASWSFSVVSVEEPVWQGTPMGASWS